MKTIVQTLKQHLFRGPLFPFLLFLTGLLAVTASSQADDIDLFRVGAGGKLKPNIMVLFDTSGSMNHLIFPPFYDNSVTYSGVYANTTHYIKYGKYYYGQHSNEYYYRYYLGYYNDDGNLQVAKWLDPTSEASNVQYFKRNARP